MELTQVVPWGRSFEEYQLMFDLSQADLDARILGCGDGPASFNAAMKARGHSVVSVDPIYEFSAEQIRSKVQETYATVISQVRQSKHQYVWKNFQDVEELGQARLAAMENFLLDYEAGKLDGRYRCQSLPSLELDDNQFDLCLCSHLLFLYSEQLSLEFHLDSIFDLLRVAQEVRIFPLLKLDGEVSPYAEIVMTKLAERGFEAQIKSVDYEFQKGGNQMMKIRLARVIRNRSLG